MEMEFLPLEVTVLEANGLKNVNLVSKMDVDAVLNISNDSGSQKHKTVVHKDCGSNPRWNQTFKFNLDENSAMQGRLFLHITLKSDKNFGSDKDIGEIRVPIKELLDANNISNGKDGARVTYDVRLPSGKPKGSLELSYKFGQKFTATMSHRGTDDLAMAYPQGYPSPSAAGYPYQGAYHPPAGYNGYGYPTNVYPPATGGYPPSSSSNAYPSPATSGANGYTYPAPSQVNAYPVPNGYSSPSPHWYAAPAAGYPAHAGTPAPGYGYPPYAVPVAAQAGYGYEYAQHEEKAQKKQKKKKKSKKGKLGGGLGAALGMGAGFLGGLLLGEAVDAAEDAGDAIEDAVEDATLGGLDDSFDF